MRPGPGWSGPAPAENWCAGDGGSRARRRRRPGRVDVSGARGPWPPRDLPFANYVDGRDAVGGPTGRGTVDAEGRPGPRSSPTALALPGRSAGEGEGADQEPGAGAPGPDVEGSPRRRPGYRPRPRTPRVADAPPNSFADALTDAPARRRAPDTLRLTASLADNLLPPPPALAFTATLPSPGTSLRS